MNSFLKVKNWSCLSLSHDYMSIINLVHEKDLTSNTVLSGMLVISESLTLVTSFLSYEFDHICSLILLEKFHYGLWNNKCTMSSQLTVGLMVMML